MTEELKPVRCGCGGKAKVDEWIDVCEVRCPYCGISIRRIFKDEAIEAWNRAMGAKDINVPDKERTAKVTTVEKPVDGCDKKITVTSCGNCETVVSLFDNYCCGCGCRLIWRETEHRQYAEKEALLARHGTPIGRSGNDRK